MAKLPTVTVDVKNVPAVREALDTMLSALRAAETVIDSNSYPMVWVAIHDALSKYGGPEE